MALCNLGEVYSNPQYGVVDFAKARMWFQKAADLKFPHGLMKLPVFLRRQALADKTNELELNIQSAIYMRDAAELGNAIAMTNFGKFLLEGTGVKVDVPEAKRMLANAVACGMNRARVILGRIFYDGKGGTTKDRNEALTLWREAAAAGDEEAAELLREAVRPT
jgi:TPR repeat protein